MTDPRRASINGQWAAFYAGLGWGVFPIHNIEAGRCSCESKNCSSPGKHPRTLHGLADATIDPATIERWWSQWPCANVGVVTGEKSGIVAIDVDPRHGGNESLDELIARHGELPPTVTAQTGGGGLHFIYKCSDDSTHNRANVRPGIDIRGEGGYFVAPPSSHTSGTQYSWVRGRGPQDMRPALMPGWLLALIEKPKVRPSGRVNSPTNGDRDLLYEAASRYVGRASPASDGDRNNNGFALSGHLFAFETADGTRLEASDVTALMEAWNYRNTPPLAPDELTKVVNSARDNGTPRTPHIVTIDDTSPIEHVWRPFPTASLPEPMARFVAAVAVAIQGSESFVALPLLAGLASAIGNTRTIRLRRTWCEPSILWTCIVGESGTMKSPAIELALRPIRKRQREAMKTHGEAMKHHRDSLLKYERSLAQWKREKGGGDPPDKPEEPTPDRCWSDDATIEALAMLLQQNPRGLLVARDELAGWLRGFDRYSKGGSGEVAKWLEVHGGRALVVDRKTSGTIFVPRAAVCITGGIQPGTLCRSLGAEHFEDGLAARLLLAMPPRRVKRWTERDVPEHVEAAVEAVFERLFELQPARDADDAPYPVALPLTPDGQAAWMRFYNEHAVEQADLVGALASAWSKLEGAAARLALVVHLVRAAAGDPTLESPDAVDRSSVEAGVRLVSWFKGEARRVYGTLAESPEDHQRSDLVAWIQRRGGSVTSRDLVRGPRRFRGDSEAAQAALDDLVAAGYGAWTETRISKAGGPPSRRFQLGDVATGDITPRGAIKNEGCVAVAGVATPETPSDAPEEVPSRSDLGGYLPGESHGEAASRWWRAARRKADLARP